MNDQRKHGIAWTDWTWPIVNGCRRISPGCEGCYAERLAATRLVHTPKYAGLATMTPSGPRWTGTSRLWAPALLEPFKLKTQARIFVADMGDLFFEEVANEEIAAVFGVMAACPWHTFQVLTKRPKQALAWFEWAAAYRATGDAGTGPFCAMWDGMNAVDAPWPSTWDSEDGPPLGNEWPLPNVHIGVSVEDRARLQRVDDLRRVPAALRFLSIEPLLEDIGGFDIDGIDWMIVGGESGPRARPFDLGWAHRLLAGARVNGIPFFLKQLGACPIQTVRGKDENSVPVELRDRAGANPAEWPAWARVQEFPAARVKEAARA